MSNKNQEDYIILKTGYNMAINDILPYITDEFDKNYILRKQAIYNGADKEYKGKQSKYWDKKNDLGYIIFEDVFGTIGYMIDLKTKLPIKIGLDEIKFVQDNLHENIYKIYYSCSDIENDIKEFFK